MAWGAKTTGWLRSKRVVLLNGSPRPEGNTAAVVKECARAIEARGVEAEIISLAGKKIESCVACYKCQENGRCSLDESRTDFWRGRSEAQ